MIRRTLCSALLGLAVVGGTALAAAPAHAAGTCTLTPPARVVINAEEIYLSGTVSGGCATDPGLRAYWYSKKTSEEYFGYADYSAGDPTASVAFIDDEIEYGVNQWLGDGVCRTTQRDCVETQDYTQSATGPSDIRAAAVTGISGSRSGTTVYLVASSYVYSNVAHRQVRRSAAGVWQVQERTGTTWRSFKRATTSTSGLTSLRVLRQPAGRKYRFVLTATPTSWTGISKSVAP